MEYMKQNSKLKIGNKFFGVYLLYILWIINVEWINFIFSLTKIQVLPFGIAEVAALFLLVVLLLFRRNTFLCDSISPKFLIGTLVILIYGLLVSVYPDRGFDTYNYHIIAQSPQFRNYFESNNFGYGQFQVWGFRLGDRLFYYFRYILGFRMGTILNTIVLAISYLQICQLLQMITECKNKNIFYRIFTNKIIWAFVILFYTQSILMFASYYVDVLAIPVGLEVLRLLLSNIKKKMSAIEMVYFALLNGIWIGFKLTNIIYVIPCVLFFLFCHYKELKIKSLFVLIFIGIYPFAVYLIYNYKYTGNPIFPYFNNIFKSIYFPLINFKDTNWGGNTVKEKILWILYAAFKPEYRQCEMHEPVYPIVLIIGLVGMLFIIINTCFYRIKYRQKISNKAIMVLIGVTLVFSVLWAFTTGYSRYFILGRILWGVIAYFFITVLLNKGRWLENIVAGIVTVLAVVCLGCNIKRSFVDGINWSWTAWKTETFKEEMKYVFRDKVFTTDSMGKVDFFVITDQALQGVIELLDNETPLINTSYAELGGDVYQEILEKHLSTAEHTADLHKRMFIDVSKYIETLNNNKFFITDIEGIDTCLGEHEIIYIEPAQDRVNTCWETNGDSYEMIVDSKDEKISLSFIAGRYYNWQSTDPITLKIYAANELEEREVSLVPIDNVTIKKFVIPLKLEKDDNKLIIRAYQSNGDIVSKEQIDKAFILNIHVE